MTDTLPPDPYKAFDLPHTATLKEITSAYRKAALRCHPDKAPGKADEFHRISSAYELLNDSDKKEEYDKTYERVQYLNKLKDELSIPTRRADSVRGGSTTGRHSGAGAGYPPGVQIRTASFSFGVGSNGGNSNFFAYGPTRVAEETSRRASARSPASSSDDRPAPKKDGFFGKAAGAAMFGLAEQVLQAHLRNQEAEREKKASSQRKTSRSEDPDRRAKSARDSLREQEREQERRRRDKEESRARQHKYFPRPTAHDESDSDDTFPARSREADQRRAVDKERARYEEEKLKKSRRYTSSRDDEDSHDERTRRAFQDAQGYIHSVNPKSPSSPNRPSLSRQNTYIPEDTYDSRTSPRAERPGLSRRTSTRQPESRYAPKEEKRSHERRASDDSSKRTTSRPQPPPLNTSNTSPATFRAPQSASPSASRRTKTFDNLDEDRAPQPGLRRAQTMPVEREPLRRSDTTHRSSRAADTAPERGSNLRYAETNDSGYSTSSPSETPAPYFPTPPKTRSSSKAVDDDEVRRFMESSRPSMSRQPSVSRTRKSPEREERSERRPEKPTINTSFRAPPVARSASYARHFPDPTPISPATSSSTRRPSLSRTDSTRHNSTSTRATSASEARTPGTPLKAYRGESYFDDNITQSPADYGNLPFRDDRDRLREKENMKRSSYAYAPSASAAEAGLKSKSMPVEYANVPIRDVRPSMPGRRESVSRGGSGARSPLYEDLRAKDRSGSSRDRDRDRDNGRRSGNSVAFDYDDRRPSKRGIW